MTREKEFLTKLAALITEYDAEITVEMGSGYQGQYLESIDIWVDSTDRPRSIEFKSEEITASIIETKIETMKD